MIPQPLQIISKREQMISLFGGQLRCNHGRFFQTALHLGDLCSGSCCRTEIRVISAPCQRRIPDLYCCQSLLEVVAEECFAFAHVIAVLVVRGEVRVLGVGVAAV